jgi:tetratricopeptide (TPR) repeat protein
MPTQLTAYRIFIASPGGLSEIRNCFRAVIEKYNTEDAVRRGVLFIPVGWELTLGGMGRPQALINQEIEECDAFFLVLHDRWGSNPGAPEGYTSGTEEEFHKALELLHDPAKDMRDISVFFKNVEPARLSDPGEQLKAVLSFKKSLEEEKKLLFQQFDDINEFEGALRMFLASWVRRHEGDEVDKPHLGKPSTLTAAVTQGFAGVEGAVAPQPHLADTAAEDEAPEAGSPLAVAAKLAADGRLTEAETMYATLTAANNDSAAAFEYGEFLFRLGRKLQAEEFLRRAIEIADVSGDHDHIARAYAALGRLLASRGDYEQGMAAMREAERLYVELHSHRELASVRLHLGETHLQLGQNAEAASMYDQALDSLSKSYVPDLGADIHAALGQLNRDTGDLASAARNYKRAIELREEQGNTRDLADFFAGFGAVMEASGELEDARAAYAKSLKLFEADNNYAGIADICDHLGHVFHALSDLNNAESAFDRSAGVFEIIQNFDGAVDAYTSLGKLQTELGRVAEATASFRQALALVGRIKNKEEATEIYERLGKLVSSDAQNVAHEPSAR